VTAKTRNPYIGMHPDLFPMEDRYQDEDEPPAPGKVDRGVRGPLAHTLLKEAKKHESPDTQRQARRHAAEKLKVKRVRELLRIPKGRRVADMSELEVEFIAAAARGETPVFVEIESLADDQIRELPRWAFTDDEWGKLDKDDRKHILDNDQASLCRVQALVYLFVDAYKGAMGIDSRHYEEYFHEWLSDEEELWNMLPDRRLRELYEYGDQERGIDEGAVNRLLNDFLGYAGRYDLTTRSHYGSEMWSYEIESQFEIDGGEIADLIGPMSEDEKDRAAQEINRETDLSVDVDDFDRAASKRGNYHRGYEATDIATGKTLYALIDWDDVVPAIKEMIDELDDEREGAAAIDIDKIEITGKVQKLPRPAQRVVYEWPDGTTMVDMDASDDDVVGIAEAMGILGVPWTTTAKSKDSLKPLISGSKIKIFGTDDDGMPTFHRGELAFGLESLELRHCVGWASMKYMEGVRKGEIKILSMRHADPKKRPMFTIEASIAGRSMLGPIEERKITSIQQIKGFSNAVPGFERGGWEAVDSQGKIDRLTKARADEIINAFKRDDVQKVIEWVLSVGVDPHSVHDPNYGGHDLWPALNVIKLMADREDPWAVELQAKIERIHHASTEDVMAERRSAWSVRSEHGWRTWNADSDMHAREQHHEAHPDEDIFEVIQGEPTPVTWVITGWYDEDHETETTRLAATEMEALEIARSNYPDSALTIRARRANPAQSLCEHGVCEGFCRPYRLRGPVSPTPNPEGDSRYWVVGVMPPARPGIAKFSDALEVARRHAKEANEAVDIVWGVVTYTPITETETDIFGRVISEPGARSRRARWRAKLPKWRQKRRRRIAEPAEPLHVVATVLPDGELVVHSPEDVPARYAEGQAAPRRRTRSEAGKLGAARFKRWRSRLERRRAVAAALDISKQFVESSSAGAFVDAVIEAEKSPTQPWRGVRPEADAAEPTEFRERMRAVAGQIAELRSSPLRWVWRQVYTSGNASERTFVHEVAHETSSEPRITISYDIITPESAEDGDVSERGWENEDGIVMEDEGRGLATATANMLRREGATEASSSTFHSGVWYTEHGDRDPMTGEQRNRAFHLHGFTEDQERDIFELFTLRPARRAGELAYGGGFPSTGAVTTSIEEIRLYVATALGVSYVSATAPEVVRQFLDAIIHMINIRVERRAPRRGERGWWVRRPSGALDEIWSNSANLGWLADRDYAYEADEDGMLPVTIVFASGAGWWDGLADIRRIANQMQGYFDSIVRRFAAGIDPADVPPGFLAGLPFWARNRALEVAPVSPGGYEWSEDMVRAVAASLRMPQPLTMLARQFARNVLSQVAATEGAVDREDPDFDRTVLDAANVIGTFHDELPSFWTSARHDAQIPALRPRAQAGIVEALAGRTHRQAQESASPTSGGVDGIPDPWFDNRFRLAVAVALDVRDRSTSLDEGESNAFVTLVMNGDGAVYLRQMWEAIEYAGLTGADPRASIEEFARRVIGCAPEDSYSAEYSAWIVDRASFGGALQIPSSPVIGHSQISGVLRRISALELRIARELGIDVPIRPWTPGGTVMTGPLRNALDFLFSIFEYIQANYRSMGGIQASLDTATMSGLVTYLESLSGRELGGTARRAADIMTGNSGPPWFFSGFRIVSQLEEGELPSALFSAVQSPMSFVDEVIAAAEGAPRARSATVDVEMRPPRRGERGWWVSARTAEAALTEVLREGAHHSDPVGWLAGYDHNAEPDEDDMIAITLTPGSASPGTGGRVEPALPERYQSVYDRVIEAINRADEIGGPEGDHYAEMMRTISEIALFRAEREHAEQYDEDQFYATRSDDVARWVHPVVGVMGYLDHVATSTMRMAHPDAYRQFMERISSVALARAERGEAGRTERRRPQPPPAPPVLLAAEQRIASALGLAVEDEPRRYGDVRARDPGAHNLIMAVLSQMAGGVEISSTARPGDPSRSDANAIANTLDDDVLRAQVRDAADAIAQRVGSRGWRYMGELVPTTQAVAPSPEAIAAIEPQEADPDPSRRALHAAIISALAPADNLDDDTFQRLVSFVQRIAQGRSTSGLSYGSHATDSPELLNFTGEAGTIFAQVNRLMTEAAVLDMGEHGPRYRDLMGRIADHADRKLRARIPRTDMSQVIGQPEAVAAVERAVATHQNILLTPPRSSTTYLIERIPTIMRTVEGRPPPLVVVSADIVPPAVGGGGREEIARGIARLIVKADEAAGGVLFLGDIAEFNTDGLRALKAKLLEMTYPPLIVGTFKGDDTKIRIDMIDEILKFPIRATMLSHSDAAIHGWPTDSSEVIRDRIAASAVPEDVAARYRAMEMEERPYEQELAKRFLASLSVGDRVILKRDVRRKSLATGMEHTAPAGSTGTVTYKDVSGLAVVLDRVIDGWPYVEPTEGVFDGARAKVYWEISDEDMPHQDLEVMGAPRELEIETPQESTRKARRAFRARLTDGTRIRFVNDAHSPYPTFTVPRGTLATITYVSRERVCAKMDVPVPGAEPDNEFCWDGPDQPLARDFEIYEEQAMPMIELNPARSAWRYMIDPIKIRKRIRSGKFESSYGFDITMFKPGGFQRVLSAVGLPVTNATLGSDGWEWRGRDGEIVLSNNPITGVYGVPRRRSPEVDFGGFIGIRGTTAFVEKAANAIVENADYIKLPHDSGDMPSEGLSFIGFDGPPITEHSNPASQPGFTDNPGWVTGLLAKHFEFLEENVPAQWLPKLTNVAGGKRAEKITAAMKEYGCGAYGCVLPTLDPKVVLKVTTDDTEYQFAKDIAHRLAVQVTVEYQLAMDIPEKYKERSVYLLWRDSADHVGEIDKVSKKRANVVENAVDVQHKAAQQAYTALHSGVSAQDEIDTWVEACRDMGKTVPELHALSLGMIKNLQKNKVFMGDVHAGNIGRVGKRWLVIDPGNIAVLTSGKRR